MCRGLGFSLGGIIQTLQHQDGIQRRDRTGTGHDLGMAFAGDRKAASRRAGRRLALDGGGFDTARAFDFHGARSHCDTPPSPIMVKEGFSRSEVTRLAGLAAGMRLEPSVEAMRGNRKTKMTLVLTVVALATLTGSKIMATPEHGPYGAIALSDSSLAYGSSWGYADPVSAYERSIAECNK